MAAMAGALVLLSLACGGAEAASRNQISLSALDGGVPRFISGSNGKKAIAAALKGDFQKARSAAGRSRTARLLVEWFYLQKRPQEAGFKRIVNFLGEHPGWPRSQTLRKNAEALLLRGNYPSGTVISYFKSYAPLSGAGKAALALAYVKAGNKDRARHWTRHAWHYSPMSKTTESLILSSSLRKFLARADFKLRMDRMLYKRSTSSGLRAAERLGRSYVALAQARIAVIKRRKNASRLVNRIKGRLASDAGLLYNRIQWNRRAGRLKRAHALLLKAPKSHKVLVDPIEWWTERRIAARQAIAAKNYRTAYRIASSHGFRSGFFRTDGEFLAGFIAFRYLKDNRRALEHFKALRANADSPKHIARSEYWLGRLAAKTGDEAQAKAHFQAASLHPYVYYGQLAANRIGRTPQISFSRPKAPGKDVRNAFRRNDLVQAIAVLGKSGKERLASTFFYALASRLKSAGEYRLMAELADDLKMKYWVLRAGKLGMKRGFPTAFYAYPRGGMPKLPRTRHVEKAMVYGLIRQESEFNAAAKSHAGARGLMQIMPGTARYIARSHKMKYVKAHLTRRPSYNARLGTLHLNDLLERFNGSYIMTIAAYNAGKGNIPKWNDAFGDPRRGEIDPVDWVELIPFTETRNYVKHVLENTQVYRARFGGTGNPVRVFADLHRGGGITSMINNTSK
mgnify:FL=1